MSTFPQTSFLTSAAAATQFVADTGQEVAFAGRSNAGKSSAINAITLRKALARVSRTPGRTQLINFFNVAGAGRVVDLPGYGFAKVPESVRQGWLALLQHYFNTRQSLTGLVTNAPAVTPPTSARHRVSSSGSSTRSLPPAGSWSTTERRVS